MIAITLRAKERIEESLLEENTDSEKAYRIISTGSEDKPMGFILDEEDEEDYVVVSDDGRSLLLIGPVLVKLLDGAIIDYGKTEMESMFVIYKQGYLN